jgi:hypothetical protein
MADVNVTIIKNTNQETILKVEGTSGSGEVTYSLEDLTADTQELIDQGTPTVNLVKVISAGKLSSSFTIKRNDVLIFACAPENAPTINLTQDGISDGINNTYDIKFNISGADAVAYVVLRKIDGWATKVENATYGAYDDPTRVGASTTASGSPDKE